MASEEGEEDYMGDLSQFIPSSEFAPPLPSKSSKKVSISKDLSLDCSLKKGKTSNWQQQRMLKREHQQIVEDQLTLENLETSIPQTNIGFKLLKQMGYTPGSALGKDGSGRAEPVKLEIRRGRGGIGKEDPRVEKMRNEKMKVERKQKDEHELLEDFGYRQKERWKGRKTVINFRKAEAALAQLEKKEVEEVQKKDGEESEEEEEQEEITEEDLVIILTKLRDEHNYCLFCGCQYESKEALLSDCPGISEDDH